MNALENAEIKRNRRMLIILLIAFLAPVLLAWIISMNKSWHPNKTKNHGDLITPAQMLPDFGLHDAQGKPLTKKQLEGKWNVIYLGGEQCDSNCVHMLYNLRQVRLAQGPNIDRVQYLYLSTGSLPDKQVLAEHPDMIMMDGAKSELEKVIQSLRQAARKDTGSVCFVDPYGRIMMSYAGNFQPKGMIKDLELLLKLR